MPDEIRTQLGFDATEAINTLNRLAKEINDYNIAIRAAAEATNYANRAFLTFNATVAKVTSSVGQVAPSAKQLGNKLEEAGQKGKAAGTAVLLSWQSVIRIFAIQTIHRAITLITNAFAQGLDDARHYGIALAEIQTVSRDLRLSTEQLSERVRAMSEQFAQPLDVVAEGLYETLSNQVTSGAESFEFLAAANKFAIAAVTDTASAVDLLSSAVNAYGFSASDTEEIAGKLFKTIELGRIRGEEFSNTFGRVLVLSGQLGVAFEEVDAAIAALTVQGLKYNEAFTLINNIQLKLIRPTDKLKEVLREMGIVSAEAGIQAYGFQGFLEKLTEVSGDTATEIGELFNRVRAIRGVLGIAGSQAEMFRDALEQIQKAGGAELEKAFETIWETDAKKFEQELIKIKNLFTDTFGSATIKTLNAMFAVLGGGPEALGAISAAAATTAMAYIAFATGVGTSNIALTLSFANLRIAATTAWAALLRFVSTPLGGAIALGAAIGMIVATMNRAVNAAERAREQIKNALEETAKMQLRTEKARRAAIEQTEKETFALIQQNLQKRQQLWTQDAKFVESLQNAVFGSITEQIQAQFDAYEQFLDIIRDKTNKAIEIQHKLKGEILDVQDSINEFNFERSIRGLSDQQQIWKQIQRSQDLVRDSNQALLRGDRERAEELAKQAESVAKQAVRTADQIKNSVYVLKANQQVNDSMNQRLRIAQHIFEQDQQARQIAEQVRGEEEARRIRIKALEEEYEKLTEIIEKGEVSPDIDLETLRQDARKITELLQKEYESAGKNARLLERYEPDVTAIRQKFESAFRDPITGIRVDLSEVVDVNLSRILEKLNAQADATPENQKIALEKLIGKEAMPGPRGYGKAQETLPKVQKSLEDAAVAQLELTTTAKNWEASLLDAQKAAVDVMDTAIKLGRQSLFQVDPNASIFDLPNTFKDIANAVANFDQNLSRVGGTLRQPEFEQLDSTIKGITTDFVRLSVQIQQALAPENFKAEGAKVAADALRQITELANIAEVRGLPALATSIRTAADALEQVVERAKAAAEKVITAETLGPLESNIKNAASAFGEMGNEAIRAGQDAQVASQAAIIALNNEKQAALAAADAYRQKAAAASGQQIKHFAGIVHKEFAGLVPRALGGQIGKDSIPVLAQVGESFNTVEATRRFFPQIQAMNAGIVPSFNRSDAGATNNFGDINIEVVEATSARETAREVMKEIKRETRRQTFNLRRSR